MSYRLERTSFIPRPRHEVFAFFSDASNLERLTPGFLNFRILTPKPIPMKSGTLIDYQLKLYGVPMRWKTLIETFQPESFFTDLQLSGPYKSWYHRHEFTDVPGGTQMRDTVDYELPLGKLTWPAQPLFVRPSLERIFNFRGKVISEVFGS